MYERSKKLYFVVPGRPVSLNATYEQRRGSGGLRRSKAAEDYYARVQTAAVMALGHKSCRFTRAIIVETVPHFTRDADAGAVSKLVQDALQGIAYRNDRGVILAVPWKGEADPENPRTEVWVRELTEAEEHSHTVILEVPVSVMLAREYPTPDMILEPARKGKGKRARIVSSARRYGEESPSATR
jgi:hypothetical protein